MTRLQYIKKKLHVIGGIEGLFHLLFLQRMKLDTTSMMLSVVLVLATAMCAVAEMSYTPAGGTTATSAPATYPPKSGSGPATAYPPKSGSGPAYPPKSGSGPAPVYPPKSGSYPSGKGSPSPPYPTAYAQSGGTDTSLRSELEEAKRHIVDQGTMDRVLNTSLNAIRNKMSLFNVFREEFLEKMYPAIEANLEKTDDRIAGLKTQLDELTSLSGLVDELVASTKKLDADLMKIRENRVGIIESLEKLQNADTDQSSDVAVLDARVKAQDTTLGEAESSQSQIKDIEQAITNNLVKVVDVINKEKSESFVIYLSTQNRTVNFTYATPFAEAPSLAYSIITFHHEEIPEQYSSGAYDKGATYKMDESINSKVVVTGDANGCSATLVDESKGWVTTFASVRITAFIKDNSIITYEGSEDSYEGSEESSTSSYEGSKDSTTTSKYN